MNEPVADVVGDASGGHVGVRRAIGGVCAAVRKGERRAPGAFSSVASVVRRRSVAFRHFIG